MKQSLGLSRALITLLFRMHDVTHAKEKVTGFLSSISQGGSTLE
jgi:hypothetical protein